MNVYYLCIGLLAALSLLLGALVTVGRGKYEVLVGHSFDPDNTLHKWVRAHANTAEYAPLLMVLIYLVSLGQSSAWVWWLVILLTACRFLFVAGILFPSTMAKPNPMRFLGAVGTYIFGLGLCLALVQQALRL
ncbi:MAPEG family protein [Microbulbifer sp. JMSA004]|uniref:MAPEG family protein n=1 Tax=unclassified Microbulbifer TaxID=2619833 RepID=UPI0024ADF617|nr:MAPEG family protein [Microbulbifer sp. VAAF005]WHI46323.1 MAPEG family protein [Microbulbifer sp. VAAF005]